MNCMPTHKRKQRKHHVAYVFMEEGIRARMGTTLSQSKGQFNKNWVLIDSQSTIDLFCNSSLLTNIRQVETKLNIFCNAGKKSTNMVGDLSGYGTVWYTPTELPTSSLYTRLQSASMSRMTASKTTPLLYGNMMEPRDDSPPVAEAFTIVILQM